MNPLSSSLTIVIYLICTVPLSAWGNTLIYSDDFSAQMADWTLSVDGGYIGQSTPQGNLTQEMIDEALSGTYANISGGTLNLKSNTTIGRDWGAASATLNIELPESFRITFSTVKTQWAGHQRFKFIESDPTAPLLYNPTQANHGRAIQFGVAGFVSGGLHFEPDELTSPELLDLPRESVHDVGHTYQYEIEKVGNNIVVLRDGALQFDYSGGLTLDFMNYLSFANYQAGATSGVDDLTIHSILEPPPYSLYWTDPAIGANLVRRASSDGSGMQTVISGLDQPRGMAIDQVNQKLYVTDLGAHVIRRSNLDGSGLETFTTIQDHAGDVAVDSVNGKVYWTDTDGTILNSGGFSGAIRRANLDGSNAEDLVTGLVHPVAIDLDVAQGKVYWTELVRKFDGMGSIQRANLDGSSLETILTGIDEANGLAIDPIAGKMYWPELSGQKIQSANLDGSGLTDVLIGLDTPTQIDLNLSEGKMYWTDSGGQAANAVFRSNLDGTSVETLISGVGFPWGIAVADILSWNQLGPGTFGYETAANWTPSLTPTADTDVLFSLDGDVDVIPFSTSVAKNVIFSDGVVRFKSIGNTTFTSQGSVVVNDPLATSLVDGAFATLDGTNGHSWTTGLDLRVGNAGFGTFIVNNGADFDAQQILIGNQTGGEGEVTVTGVGSTMAATLNTDTSLYRVGFTGGTGTLNVQGGASITTGLVGDVSLGDGLGSVGTLNVSGPNSSVVTDDLLVGLGGVGFVNITGGGLVDQSVGADPDTQVAVSDLSANIGAGTVVVNGDDSRWNFRQGEFGSAGLGSVAVEAGGRIAATADVTVGLDSTSQGSLHVTGIGTLADSLVSVGGDLTIGELGQGTLTVDLGGDVTVDNDLLVGGDISNLNNNVVTITNPGSSIMVTGRLEVGIEGMGTLNITDGGTASSFSLTAGDLLGGNGIITLSGVGSNATAVGTSIGTFGTGSLTISEGAHLDSGRLWVGFADGSDSTVDVNGPGSTLTATGSGVSMRIGGEPTFAGGTGTMTISQGGTVVSSNDNYIGGNSSSTGALIVTGPLSRANFNDGGLDDVLAVGYAGVGSLSILDGGGVESEVATLGQLVGANGTVDVGNGNAMANWNVDGSLSVGGSASAVGGTGLLNINSQGTVTVAGELKIWDDGAVILNSPAATLSVGSLAFTAGSQFIFQQGNLVLTGSGLDINPAGTLGESVSIVPGQTLSTTGGGLVNDGDLNVIGTTVSFAGGPSVNNAGAEVNAINATLTFDGDLTNNGDVNLINTTVNGSLINGGSGALAMIGSNAFSDGLQFGGDDNLYVDLGGSTPGEFDTLSVGGEAALDGSLNVSFVSNFSPSAGDSFEIITAASVLGVFDTVNLPALPGDLLWFVNYGATSVELVSTFGADFDEDGDVDSDDLAEWQAGFGSTPATHMTGDANADKAANGADFLTWQRQVGSGVAIAGANTAVPEPSTLLLSLLGLAAVGMRYRRCSRA